MLVNVGEYGAFRKYGQYIYINENEKGPDHIPAALNAGVIVAPKARQKEPEIN